MACYNHIGILGTIENLNKKTLPTGVEIVEFTLAANDSYVNKAGEKVAKRVEITVVFMGSIAARLDRPLQNGEKVIVEGRLQSNSKESNGTKRVWYSIIGQTVTFMSDAQQKPQTIAPQKPVSQDEFPF